MNTLGGLPLLGDPSPWQQPMGGEDYEGDLRHILFYDGGVYPPDAIISPTMRARLEEVRLASEHFAKVFQAPGEGEPVYFEPPLTLGALWLCGCDTYNYAETLKCSHCGKENPR